MSKTTPTIDPITKHQFIRVYPGALPPETCQNIIKYFENSPDRKIGRLGMGSDVYDPKLKRCMEMSPDPKDVAWAPLNMEIFKAVHSTFCQYMEDVPRLKLNVADNQGKVTDTGFQIQRYEASEKSFEEGGDGFGWHVDVNSTASSVRFLALIIYLNFVRVGGETEFSGQGIKVAPRAGTVLWFPPTFEYEHCGITPVSGPKMIITSFMMYGDVRGQGAQS